VVVRFCSLGQCRIRSCAANYLNCDGLFANGCEANIQTNASHCGMCNRACPAGRTCAGGVCQ
jgi:hypothetical protein